MGTLAARRWSKSFSRSARRARTCRSALHGPSHRISRGILPAREGFEDRVARKLLGATPWVRKQWVSRKVTETAVTVLSEARR